MKETFYFLRDENNRKIVTVCLLINTDLKIIQARGVAICSDRDTPCSKLNAHQSNGPGIARRRAWKSWKQKQNLYLIVMEEAVKVLDKVIKNQFPDMYIYKSFYQPAFSEKEFRVLGAVIRHESIPMSEVETFSR